MRISKVLCVFFHSFYNFMQFLVDRRPTNGRAYATVCLSSVT